MDFESIYLCWKGVASKQAYYVQRWDDWFDKDASGPPLNLTADKPLADIWPASVLCIVFQDYAHKKPVLQDYLMNEEGWLVISDRLKTFVEKTGVPEVEYLPIQVIDPTGLRLNDAYWIVHTLNSPDCLDLEASGAKRSRVIPTKAEKIQRIAFKNDPGRPLFRPSTFSKITLISWTLAEAIAAEGFTGFRFMGLFDYGVPADLPPHPKRPPVDTLCSRLWKNGQARS